MNQLASMWHTLIQRESFPIKKGEIYGDSPSSSCKDSPTFYLPMLLQNKSSSSDIMQDLTIPPNLKMDVSLMITKKLAHTSWVTRRYRRFALFLILSSFWFVFVNQVGKSKWIQLIDVSIIFCMQFFMMSIKNLPLDSHYEFRLKWNFTWILTNYRGILLLTCPNSQLH